MTRSFLGEGQQGTVLAGGSRYGVATSRDVPTLDWSLTPEMVCLPTASVAGAVGLAGGVSSGQMARFISIPHVEQNLASLLLACPFAQVTATSDLDHDRPTGRACKRSSRSPQSLLVPPAKLAD